MTAPVKVWLHLDASSQIPSWQTRALGESLEFFLSKNKQVRLETDEGAAAVKIFGHLEGGVLSLSSLDAQTNQKLNSAKITLGSATSLEELRHQTYQMVRPAIQKAAEPPATYPLDGPTAGILVALALVGTLGFRALLRWVRPLSSHRAAHQFKTWPLLASVAAAGLFGLYLVKDSLRYHRVYEERMLQTKKSMEKERQLEWEKHHGTK